MLRNKDWKLILSLAGPLGSVAGRTDRVEGELYHLPGDPLELNNRHDDPACAEVRQDMTAQLPMHLMCALGRLPSGPSRAEIRVAGPETRPDGSLWTSNTGK